LDGWAGTAAAATVVAGAVVDDPDADVDPDDDPLHALSPPTANATPSAPSPARARRVAP
jgi:hypothetical protein